MNNRNTAIERITKETSIKLSINLENNSSISLDTGLPFFDHMLNALFFHGGFSIKLKAAGDIAVDPHHLVEDCGIVIGSAFREVFQKSGGVKRFGHSIIPMDDALSEAVVDVCERPYLVYQAEFPQPYSGNFDMSLFKEFFLAFTTNARINLHLLCRYGENSHHMIEALFKAFGKALGQAYTLQQGDTATMSTKGSI